MSSKLDSQINELYQLRLDEFTEKRNALVKELSGSAKTQVRHLAKPSLPIWAINQLYWRERPTYDALVDASEKLRAAHRAMLAGHKTDVRKPEQLHRAALERAASKTVALMEKNGAHASSSVLETIRQTLSALPTEEPPGRLIRPPEPVGFSLLTGIKPRPVSQTAPTASAKAAPRVDHATAERVRKAAERAAARERKKQERAEAQQRRAAAQAERKLKIAKAAAERAANRLKEAQSRLAELEDKVRPSG